MCIRESQIQGSIAEGEIGAKRFVAINRKLVYH